MINEFTGPVTFEWLEKNGLTGSCKSCGIKGVFCDDDLDVYFKSKFYPVEKLVDSSPMKKHLDDRSELCPSCRKLEEK